MQSTTQPYRRRGSKLARDAPHFAALGDLCFSWSWVGGSKRSSAAGADIEEVARLSWRASYIYAACAAGTVHGALPSRRAAAPLVARCRCHTCVSTSWPLTILVVVPLWQHENPVRSTREVFTPQLRGVKTLSKATPYFVPFKNPLGAPNASQVRLHPTRNSRNLLFSE